jgi:PAS domain S-box-containing protein
MTKARILVVEDEQLVAEHLRRELVALGYADCAPVASGEEALRAVAETLPDLALMDIKLAGAMDGVEAAERLRAGFDIPVVYLTAYADDATLARARITEPYGYLVKPFTDQELRATIEMALHKHQLEKKVRENEERYRGLFENVPVGLYRATPERQILDANPALVEMLGCPDQESLLASYLTERYLNAVDRNRWQDQMERDGSLRDFESQWRRFDGTLMWVSESARAFQDAEGRLLSYEGSVQDITERVGAEAERDAALEALRQRNRELALLNQAGQALNSSLALDQVLVTVLEEVRRLLDVAACSAWLVDPETDELVCRQATEPKSEMVRGWRLAPGEGIAGWVVRHSESLIVPDAEADERYFKGVDEQTGLGLRSILGLPLRVKRGVIGVLEVVDDEVGRFDAADLALLEPLAASAAIAIENARLYEQAQARSRYLETLQRINATLRSTLPLDDVLETVACGAGEALDYAGSLILLPDVKGERLIMGAVWGGRFLDAALRLAGLEVRSFSLPLTVEENPLVQTYLSGELQYGSRKPEQIVLGVEPAIPQQLAPLIARGMGTKLGACVPLPVGDSVVGVLVVFSPREGLPDEERAMLLGLADQAGLAIQNAQLYQAAQRELAERVRATEELQREKQFSELLIRSSVDGTLAFDRECRYTVWNPGMERISGVGKAEAIGRLAFDVFPFLKETGEDSFFFEALAGKTAVAENRPYVIPETGRRGFFEGRYSPVIDESGEILGGLAIIHDITERVQAEEERRRLHEQVQRHAAELEERVQERTTELRARVTEVGNLNRAMANLLGDLQASNRILEATGQQLGRANSLISALGQVTVLLQSSLDPDQVLEILGTELRRLNLTCIVALLDEKEKELVLRYAAIESKVLLLAEKLAGVQGSGLRLSLDRFLIYTELVEGRRPVFVPEVMGLIAAALPGVPEALLKRILRLIGLNPDSPVVYAPLAVRERVLGVMGVWGDTLQEENVPAFTIFAGQVAAALEVARLHGQLREARIEEQSALLRLSQALLGEIDLQDILDLAVREAAQALGVERAAIALVDADGHHYSARARFGWPPEFFEQVRDIPVDHDTAMGYAILAQTPVVTPETGREPYHGAPAFVTEAGITASLVVPMLVAGKAQGGLVVDSRTPRQWSDDEVRLLSLFANSTAQALERARLFEQVRTGRERLETLSRRLLEAQETERRRIARELHDQIGQALTVLKISLQGLVRSCDAPTLALKVEEYIRIVEGTIRQVRELSFDLRPSILDDLGLVPALRWYLDRQAQQTGFSPQFAADPLPERLPPHLEIACFRIAQEALTNVIRHAQAHQVGVELRQGEGELHLVIRDDGVGFDVAGKWEPAARGECLGLLGMEERAHLVGGQVEIESTSGHGTEVHARFPLA